MPSRKRDFARVLSGIADVFMESTDRTILDNCGLILASYAKQSHARTGEALVQLKKTTGSLYDRLIKLFREKQGCSIDKVDGDTASARDVENSIALCLQRLVVLSKRLDISDILGEPDEDTGNDDTTKLCAAIAEHLARELQARKVIFPDDEEADDVIPQVWMTGDDRLHAYVADSTKEGLSLLLTVAAYRLKKEIELIDEDTANESADFSTHFVIQMRDRLLKLIHYCFEQHVEPTDERIEYPPEHLAFASAVQSHACVIAGDLRGLFLKQWGDAKSPFLRACALVDKDDHVLGGYARFLSSSEEQLRENAIGQDNPAVAETLLQPLARGLTMNWKLGHRREAGSALSHISGSGEEAHKIIMSMARTMKRVRFCFESGVKTSIHSCHFLTFVLLYLD